jgi:hypothetical protein
MTGKLFRYELYKVLFSYRVIWLAAAFIILKAAVLCILPELKDSRIAMSQKQYDTVLAELAGETTPEKERYISETYAGYRSVLEQYKENQDLYLAGKLKEEPWQEYLASYEEARLYANAFSIFNEKADRFSALRSMGASPPPAYFYEYGWDSVFTYLSYPDPLLLLFLLMLGIQFICPEIASGAMQIASASRNGRRPLFFSKLTALSAILGAMAMIDAVIEISIFSIRFPLGEGYWPIYSITPFSAGIIQLDLIHGLLMLAVIRGAGLILAGILIWAIACLTGNAAQSVFCSILLILLPWLFNPDLIYTVNAWMSGTPVLKGEHRLLALLILCLILILLLRLAYLTRFRKKGEKG